MAFKPRFSKWIARCVAIAVMAMAALPVHTHYAVAASAPVAAATPCHESPTSAGDLSADHGVTASQCQSLCASASLADAPTAQIRLERENLQPDLAAVTTDVASVAPRRVALPPDDASRSRTLRATPDPLVINHRLQI